MPWVTKTPEDYANHIAAIQKMVEQRVKKMQGNVMVAAVNHAVAVIMRAMELAPRQTGYMAAQAMIRVNGAYIKAPGSESVDRSAIESVSKADRLIIEYGWEGPIAETKDGKKYNLAFIHEIHVEFNHQNGQAKFFQTANEEIGPRLISDLWRAIRDVVKGWFS